MNILFVLASSTVLNYQLIRTTWNNLIIGSFRRYNDYSRYSFKLLQYSSCRNPADWWRAIPQAASPLSLLRNPYRRQFVAVLNIRCPIILIAFYCIRSVHFDWSGIDPWFLFAQAPLALPSKPNCKTTKIQSCRWETKQNIFAFGKRSLYLLPFPPLPQLLQATLPQLNSGETTTPSCRLSCLARRLVSRRLMQFLPT